MKSEIRREILERRKYLDENLWIEKSIKVQKTLIEKDFYKNTSSILVYCYFDKEVMTDIIINDALEKNKVVCIPYNEWEAQTFIPSRIYSVEDIDRTKKIPQPFKKNPFPPESIQVAIIPGVAFDIYGSRIGMGKGFFDKFLKIANRDMLKVSLAFDFQVLDKKLPVDIWDQKVDIIITETRVIKTSI
ncbi:MAG: 5-formyltetrahydrofolate cyclo-ligase [bacterium]|nr:5-formyltetrahydrofolate cyclo-ligase [bacterium]